jgi:hypothetical protein
LNTYSRKLRLSIITAFIAGILPVQAFAAIHDATFELHPHCIEREGKDDDWIFGPIPSPGTVLETRDIEGVRCSNFEIEDPQTLRTRPLRKGDILDIDVVIDNPGKRNVERVRIWLSYDPNILEGTSAEINEAFSVVTPDEKDFSPDEGYVKMEASTESGFKNGEKILFARIQFTIIETNAIGSPITFYDVQPGGHSIIEADNNGEKVNVVKEEPGVLLVKFAEDTLSPTESVEAESSDEDGIGNIFESVPEADVEPEPVADPNACVRNEDCHNGSCKAGQCVEEASLLANGASCSKDDECESILCGSGICIPNIGDAPDNANIAADTSDQRTAFSLLQIRNVRITTEGTSAFLAWDKLRSSQIKANTIYYSKTSGRYMQRRTIDKSENSLTFRSLEAGKRYYFAVRALSKQDEESAFSREVSIVIGDPESSSAPLVPGSITDGPGKNPVANIRNGDGLTPVPGETGLPSAVVLFLIGSAIVGTSFASRRQFVVSDTNPHE